MHEQSVNICSCVITGITLSQININVTSNYTRQFLVWNCIEQWILVTTMSEKQCNSDRNRIWDVGEHYWCSDWDVAWSAAVQTVIREAISELNKRLRACVCTRDVRFEHFILLSAYKSSILCLGKQHNWLLIITLANLDSFSKFFSVRFPRKLYLPQCLPPIINCVASLPCEIQMFKIMAELLLTRNFYAIHKNANNARTFGIWFDDTAE